MKGQADRHGGGATDRVFDGDVEHRSVREPGPGLLCRADLKAFGLDPELELGVDGAALVPQDQPWAALLVRLQQSLQDLVVLAPRHGLGLSGVPVRAQAPVLELAEHPGCPAAAALVLDAGGTAPSAGCPC